MLSLLHSMTARRVLLAVLSSVLSLGLAWGCSAVDNSSAGPNSSGGVTGVVEAGADGHFVEPDGPVEDDEGGLGLNALCNKRSTCVPDDRTACGDYSAPLVPGPDASVGGDAGATSSLLGASGAGGEGGVSSGGSGSSSGAAGADAVSGAGGDAGAGGQAGAAGAPAVDSPKFACQVGRIGGGSKSVISSCRVAGRGAANAPCLTAADCQAGYGCVGDQSSGLCEKYCCLDAHQCGAGTYCAERPMRDEIVNALAKEDTSSSAPMIPVCVPAENCDLGAPYPCTVGTQCACQAGTACLVVRSDGTTTCAVPGAGKVGDACPCAWGHVCSAATNQCLKLCYTRGASTCTGDGKCQSATELPDGWGVCVGGTVSGG